MKWWMIYLVLLVSFSLQAQQVFPEVSVKTLEGKAVNINDYLGKGHPVYVTFWATWCTPCKKELDALSDLYEDWKEDYQLEIVAVTIDNARALSKVGPMVSSKGWPFVILSDPNKELMTALGFQTIPQSYLVDAEGKIVYAHNGYAPGDEYVVEDKLKALK